MNHCASFAKECWQSFHAPWRNWPFTVWMFFLSVPCIILFLLISSYVQYSTVKEDYLSNSSVMRTIESQVVADAMAGKLTVFRDGLVTLSDFPALSPETLQHELQLIFGDSIEFIVEIGVKEIHGGGFMLLRDGEIFREASLGEVTQSPYSAFQQISTLPLREGVVTVFPAVKASYSVGPQRNRLNHVTLIRLATPLPGRSGILSLGISLQEMQRSLERYFKPGSPFFTGIGPMPFQFSYFFDYNGWILFEMSESDPKEDIPVNLSRRGFTGDLGRAGLDSAFRPWAVHEQFWRMVKDVQNGGAGSLILPLDYFSNSRTDKKALISYAPVFFVPEKDADPVVLGGLALAETTAAAQKAFTDYLVTAFVICGVAVIFSFAFFSQAHVFFSVPLRTLAASIKNLPATQDFSVVTRKTKSKEEQAVLAAVNGLIAQCMGMCQTLARVKGEADQARARQPVELSDIWHMPAKGVTGPDGIVGSGSLISAVRSDIRRAAKAGTDVLVWGETGTGKELVAEAIHNHSIRKDGPLISVNCGALDEHLLLDMLFGHVKGAFTEAKSDRKGAFLAAERGTLHLDEIGNASLQVQKALLRALSVRRIRPLGTDREIPFDTRVVAATNLDLMESVKAGAFREDLYYRLAIISIKTPALRQRKEDIPELAAFCLSEFAENMGKKRLQLSRGALEKLAAYDWPGNVREFKNCMLRAIAFAEKDIILAQHIILTETEMAGKETDSLPLPLDKEESAAAYERTDPGPAEVFSGLGSNIAIDLPAGLNERQKAVWSTVARQGEITRAQYQAAVGGDVSARTAQHDLRDLVERGLLEKAGAGPGTRYLFRRG